MSKLTKEEQYAEELIRSHIPTIYPDFGKLLTKKAWGKAKSHALIDCNNTIEELKQLRKPEYTSFIIKHAKYKKGLPLVLLDAGEVMDGYEKLEFFQSVKKHLESKQG